MSDYAYTLNATVRQDNGKGASRRLRREGLVPAIVYGGEGEPISIAISQNELIRLGRFDSFYSQIICLKIEGQEETEVVVRDVQRHLYKPLFQHFDFQRIVRGQEMNTIVTLHFINEEESKGVKEQGGIIDHHLNTVEIICLPRDIPEYVTVDMAGKEIGDVIHLKDLTFPEGVRLAFDDERVDAVVAQVIYPQQEEIEEEETDDTVVGEEEETSTDEEKDGDDSAE